MKEETVEFFNHMNEKFKEILEEKKRVINIVKESTGEVVDLNYSKIFFDADLNIYKIDKETGKPVLIKKDSGFVAKLNINS